MLSFSVYELDLCLTSNVKNGTDEKKFETEELLNKGTWNDVQQVELAIP